MDEGGAATAMDEAIVRVGSHHQVILGREFHVGLFRFFLPRLERTQEEDEEAQHEMALLAPSKEWDATPASSSSSIQYIIDLSGNETANVLCHLVDAAAVLYKSLQELQPGKKAVPMHAIVNSQRVTRCNVTSALTKIGYQVVNDSSLKGCPELWQTYAMQNLTKQSTAVVVHLPPTAIAKHQLPKEEADPSRLRHQRKRNIRTRSRALSSSVYSSSQAIQILRISGSSNTKSDKHNSCAQIAPTVCHSSPCQISKQISLVVPPRKCYMPWDSCSNESEQSSSSCRSYHYLWKQQRGSDIMCKNGTYVALMALE